MAASKRDYQELIQEYNHQMMISNLQMEALLYETLDCDKSYKNK